MKNKILIITISIITIFNFSNCNIKQQIIKYQYSAYKEVHHEIENSNNFELYNDYQKDFLILANIVKDAYPNCDEFISDSLWEISVKEELKNLKNATDTSAVMVYEKFLAQLKNNHTYVIYPKIYNMGKKIFLITAYYIDNKWIIFDVHKEYPNKLITKELIAINDIPIDTFYNKIEPYLGEESDENMRHFTYSRVLFGRQIFINQLGLGNKTNPDLMKVTVVDSNNVQKDFEIEAKNLDKSIAWSEGGYGIRNSIIETDSGYIYRFFPEDDIAYLQINQFMDKKAWKRGIKNETPFIFWPFAFNMLRKAYKGKPSGRLGSVKPGTEDITDFYEDFFTKLKESDCHNLVIDVRNNIGGNIFYTYQLISFLSTNNNIKTYTRYIKESDFYNQVSDNKEIKKHFENLPKKVINYDTLVDVSSLEDDFNVFENINNPDYDYYINSEDKKFEGNVWVLTSPNSISAATAFPVLVQDNNLGKIVGRSPANRASRQTSTAKFKLPYSSIVIGLSTLYLTRPDINNTEELLIPDYYVPVEISHDDYTFEYLKNLIEN